MAHIVIVGAAEDSATQIAVMLREGGHATTQHRHVAEIASGDCAGCAMLVLTGLDDASADGAARQVAEARQVSGLPVVVHDRRIDPGVCAAARRAGAVEATGGILCDFYFRWRINSALERIRRSGPILAADNVSKGARPPCDHAMSAAA